MIPFVLGLRRVGWFLSKNFFYTIQTPIAMILSIAWGFFIFYIFNLITLYFNPNLFLKWILGFTASIYVANPAYGLISENTIPSKDLPKHQIINSFGILTFVITAIGNEIFLYLN